MPILTSASTTNSGGGSAMKSPNLKPLGSNIAAPPLSSMGTAAANNVSGGINSNSGQNSPVVKQQVRPSANPALAALPPPPSPDIERRDVFGKLYMRARQI